MSVQTTVERTTAGTTENTLPPVRVEARVEKDVIDLEKISQTENVLHRFKSYNYLFTLSAVPIGGVTNINDLHVAAETYVVARSHGKIGPGIETDSLRPIYRDLTADQTIQYDENGVRFLPALVADYGGKDIVQSFNERSPGRFNLYFQDVEIESIMAFDRRTGFAKANKISFTIHEPYSLAGFIEALQVSAVAAGHPTYKSAPFVLKLNFMGHPDYIEGPNDEWRDIRPGTRYFVIRFTEVQIKADETGTRYHCKAVPINELTFGEPNKIKTNISMSGNKVKDILKNFITEINRSVKAANNVSSDVRIRGNQAQCDEYEIFFPSIDATGTVNYEKENSKFTESLVADLARDSVNYEFIDPSTKQKLEKTPNTRIKYNPTEVSVQFAAQSNIHDIIATVLRDSSYFQNLLRNIETRITDNEFIEYFTISLEAVPKALWDTARNQPFYIYRYFVIPYSMHYTKIPGFESRTINVDKLRKSVSRTYEYFYTGKNIDIISFNLNFNHLYFQTQPLNQGVKPIYGQRTSIGGSQNPTSILLRPTSDPVQVAKGAGTEPSPTLVSAATGETQFAGGGTRYIQDAYHTLTRNLAQSILDNTAMSTVEMEIIGDPVFLVQNGVGNIRTRRSSIFSLTENSVDNLTGDIYIEIRFKNPKDVPNQEGKVDWNEVGIFSGIYKVNTVKSRFSDGFFKQTLSLYRIPGQPEVTRQPPTRIADISPYEERTRA